VRCVEKCVLAWLLGAEQEKARLHEQEKARLHEPSPSSSVEAGAKRPSKRLLYCRWQTIFARKKEAVCVGRFISRVKTGWTKGHALRAHLIHELPNCESVVFDGRVRERMRIEPRTVSSTSVRVQLRFILAAHGHPGVSIPGNASNSSFLNTDGLMSPGVESCNPSFLNTDGPTQPSLPHSAETVAGFRHSYMSDGFRHSCIRADVAESSMRCARAADALVPKCVSRQVLKISAQPREEMTAPNRDIQNRQKDTPVAFACSFGR